MGEKILQGFRLKISQNGLLFSWNDQNVIFKCHGVNKFFQWNKKQIMSFRQKIKRYNLLDVEILNSK